MLTDVDKCQILDEYHLHLAKSMKAVHKTYGRQEADREFIHHLFLYLQGALRDYEKGSLNETRGK